VEPIDRRTTAARLLTLRNEPNAAREIADLLGVSTMPGSEAARMQDDIAAFVRSGDGTLAAQLLHRAALRRGQGEPAG
jgi:hypothetical protein